MKKLLALILAMMMALSLVACGDSGNNPSAPSGGDIGVDLSAYPTDINEWSAQQLLDYFKEAVPALNECEDWFQPHVPYWTDTPINDVSGTWNDDGTIQLECRTFDPENPDTTPEEVEAWKQNFRDDANHGYVTDEFFIDTNSHMAGNVVVNYEWTTNDDVYEALETAWNGLVSALGVTPDF